MNRTLFAGDLHAKGDLLPFISNMADREHADRIVLLGDICDDWHVSNTGMIRFMIFWRGYPTSCGWGGIAFLFSIVCYTYSSY